MKMIYEFDIQQIKTLTRAFGLAMAVGGFISGVLDNGDLFISSSSVIVGTIIAILGTLKEREHD